MKIKFLGLSSFLIENKLGHKILVDPYNDSPKWNFGFNFPKNIHAEIVLMSHMDADHASYRPETSIEPPNKTNYKKLEYNVRFPNIDLRGTLIKEYNGYPNIAWHYNIDGFRLLHLADNDHLLTKKQLNEFGKVDIIFISSPKFKESLKTTLDNIKLLNPNFMVWSHHIPVKPSKETKEEKIKKYFEKLILPNKQNRNATMQTVEVFTNILLSILEMNKNFKNIINIDRSTIEIKRTMFKKEPTVLFFRKSAAK